MPSSPSPCNHPELCARVIQDILALGPTPSRAEYEWEPALKLLSRLYTEEQGLEFLARLETFVARVREVYAFPRMPSLAQVQVALNEAYARGLDLPLQHLLRAYSFYWQGVPPASRGPFNVFAQRASRDLGSPSRTCFCGGCGALDLDPSRTCPRCGSTVFELCCYQVPERMFRGVQLHIPSELHAVNALESAAYHIVRMGGRESGSGISLSFDAFGATVDVDAIGVGHPPCVILISMTTSRLDQGKAMRAKGTLESLVRMIRQRIRDKVPIHLVLATTDVIDENLDVVGTDRAGMTVYGQRQMMDLAAELAKIPSRLDAG